MSRAPDVTVITAVYNTMPYVTGCVESVLAQTIGTDRIELIAVDDGSSDDSGAELDRFAAAHPDTVTVVHQDNSGGPAAPSNRALDLATGRYVFFLGSDDHLGPEALERLVNCADEHGADVVLGRMVGVGGRRAPRTAFEQPGTDVPFPQSKLVWALSNTKLFRRDRIEARRLRFFEDVSVYSDVPFTIEAMADAARIATLTDYDYYYTVERDDAANVTYSSKLTERLHATGRIVDTICRRYEPGPDRDALLYRTFAYEQWILLQEGLIALGDAEQAAIVDGVADLADAHLTDAMRRRLPVEKRVRLAYAQRRDRAGLLAAIARTGPLGFTVDHGRAYARYPGFRDRTAGLDDAVFAVAAGRVTEPLARGIEPLAVGWTKDRELGPCLEYTCRLAVTGIEAADLAAGAVALEADARPARRRAVPRSRPPTPAVAASLAVRAEAESTLVTARFGLRDLAATGARSWAPRLYVTLGEWVYDLPLKTVDGPVERRGRRGFTLDWGKRGSLRLQRHEHTSGRGLARFGITTGRK